MRGEAYLAANQAAAAAAEFQKILDHLSIIFVDPGGAVARLVGSAFAASDDRVRARNAY